MYKILKGTCCISLLFLNSPFIKANLPDALIKNELTCYSECISPPPVILQELGLPVVPVAKLFSLIDEQCRLFVNKIEKKGNIEGLFNAVLLHEYNSLYLIESRNDQRNEALKEGINKNISILEKFKLPILKHFSNIDIDSAFKEEQIDDCVQQLFFAQKENDLKFYQVLTENKELLSTILHQGHSLGEQQKKVNNKLDQEFVVKKEQIQLLEQQIKALSNEIQLQEENKSNLKKKELEKADLFIAELKSNLEQITVNRKVLIKENSELDIQRTESQDYLFAIQKIENFKGTPVTQKTLERRIFDTKNDRHIEEEQAVKKEIDVNSTKKNEETIYYQIDKVADQTNNEVHIRIESVDLISESDLKGEGEEILGQEGSTYIVISNLESSSKQVLNLLDKAYVSKAINLETRTLNSGEIRVLIDLHRKMIDKIDAEQSAIQFGDKSASFDDELEILVSLDAKITTAVQKLNRILSDESEFKNSKETKIIAAKIEGNNVKNEINTPIIVVGQENQNEVLVSDTLTSPQENVYPETIKKDSSLPMIYQGLRPAILNRHSEAWGQCEVQIRELDKQIVEQKKIGELSKNKKQKKQISFAIAEMKNQKIQLEIEQVEIEIARISPFVLSNGMSNLTDYITFLIRDNEELAVIQNKEKYTINQLTLVNQRLTNVEFAHQLSVVKEIMRINEALKKEGVQIVSRHYLEFPIQVLLQQEELVKEDLEKDKQKIKSHVRVELNDKIEIKETVYEELQQLKFDLQKQWNSTLPYQEEVSVLTNAPNYNEEYRILSSIEYQNFVNAKVKFLNVIYELQLNEIQTERLRNETTEIYLAEGKSIAYFDRIVALKELSNEQKKIKSELNNSLQNLKFVSPKEEQQNMYFENLFARNRNPIVNKELETALIVLDQKGVNFNEQKVKRKEVLTEKGDGLVYRVQVGAFKNALPDHVFKEFSPISTEQIPESDITRFLAGFFPTQASAQAAQKEIIDLGYNDAFVIAYVDGERISLTEANKLLKSKLQKEKSIDEIAFEINQNNVLRAKEIEPTKVDYSTIEELDYNKDEFSVLATPLERYSGLFFTVQIGAYQKPISADRLKNEKPVYTFRLETGQIRYMIGMFTDLTSARTRERELLEKNFSGAYVTAYYQGKRISIAQAMDLLDKGIVPSLLQDEKTEESKDKTFVSSEIPMIPARFPNNNQRKERQAQLVSNESFNNAPIDFLQRLRANGYFYYDQKSGRVRSQLQDESYFLGQNTFVKTHFDMVNDPVEIKQIAHQNYIQINLPFRAIPGELADLLVRLTMRIEVISLENSYELRIFAPEEEALISLQTYLQKMGFPTSIKTQKK